MANLSAALNALSSTVVVDFLGGAGPAGERGAVRRARLATVAWAAALVGIAYAARHSHSVLEAGLTIASIPSGALLGVFLLGVLTRRPGEWAAMAGVVAGLAAALVVRFETPVAFTWYVHDRSHGYFCVAAWRPPGFGTRPGDECDETPRFGSN